MTRLDYQPLFGKGARGEGGPDTRERRKSSLIDDLFFIPPTDKFTSGWDQGWEIATEPFPNNFQVGV